MTLEISAEKSCSGSMVERKKRKRKKRGWRKRGWRKALSATTRAKWKRMEERLRGERRGVFLYSIIEDKKSNEKTIGKVYQFVWLFNRKWWKKHFFEQMTNPSNQLEKSILKKKLLSIEEFKICEIFNLKQSYCHLNFKLRTHIDFVTEFSY